MCNLRENDGRRPASSSCNADAAGTTSSTGAVVSGALASVLLVVALALSVAKPFGRVRGKDGRIRAPRP